MTELGLLLLVILAAAVSFFAAFAGVDGPGGAVVESFLAFLAAILWGAVALSAYDVTLVGDAVLYSREWTIYVYLGIGLAFIMLGFSLYKIVSAVGKSAEDADVQLG